MKLLAVACFAAAGLIAWQGSMGMAVLLAVVGGVCCTSERGSDGKA